MTKSCPERLQYPEYISLILFILLFLPLFIVFIASVSADGIDNQVNETGTANQAIGPDQSRASRDISFLMGLLDAIGFDISYGGDGGTIFSMVDESLTQIITSLSSGNVEGFMDIHLIRETLAYFGMSVDDIVLDPNMTPEQMEAIDAYHQKYE